MAELLNDADTRVEEHNPTQPSANGREEWKDRFGRSINTITKRATDPTKARKVKQHS